MRDDEQGSWPETLLRFGVLAVLVLSPLPFGAVQPWAVVSIQVSTVLLAAIALPLVVHRPELLPKGARLLMIPIGAMILVGLLQLVPLPHSWVELLAPRTAATRAEVGPLVAATGGIGQTLSLEPAASRDALLRLVSYVLFGLVVVVAFRRARELERLALVVAACGLFQAVYGAAEYLTGRNHIFGYAKQYNLDRATGSFINQNHFAAYLAMAACFGTALLLRRTAARQALSGWRQRIVHVAQANGMRWVFGAVAVSAIWAGIFLSYSRGGLAAALAGALALTAFGTGKRRGLAIGAAVMLVPMLLLLWQDVRVPGERFLSLSSEVSPEAGRLAAWGAGLDMIREQPIVGTGLGTFAGAFPMHRPPQIRVHFQHLHNEWLQAAAEGGLLLWLPIAAAIAVLVWARARAGESDGEIYRRAAVAALVAVGLHAVVDFPLRVPAIALLCSAAVGVVVAGGPRSRSRHLEVVGE